MSRKKIKKVIIAVLLTAVLFTISGLWLLFGPRIQPGPEAVLYIPTGSAWEQVIDSLNSKIKIKDPRLFSWIADKKSYKTHIRPGRYVLDHKYSYVGLVNFLRSGEQSAINITFSVIRTVNEIAGKVGGKIEADSSEFMAFFSDPSNYNSDGFTKETIISVFIPNTYKFLWTTSPEAFYRRMLREYKSFWNDERLAKAKISGLNPLQVSILASIVDDEVAKADEKPRIAGVYLNRLKRGMPLQACPTIRFALNDYTITRVLYKHLKIESPYNTYKYRGLPPGPIRCPSVEGLDAVLNAEKHDYIFFAAKDDFSGYHNFSRTLTEHNRYASSYQKELNRRKIFK
jgi:UPF0755 protein